MVSDARVAYNNMGGQPEVDMAMNAEGAQTWARLTADNIGRSIAIVLDGMVYSFPRVNTEITGGRSVISGSFTIEEATDLANVLNSGKLPAPATIVQEQVVGPSLGSASIQAGMISFVIAFLCVLLYMIIFYHPSRYRRSGADPRYGGGRQRDHLRACQGGTPCRQGSPSGCV